MVSDRFYDALDTIDIPALCGGGVTLNGNRATVSGYRNDFATVTDLVTGLSGEWAWQSVGRIRANGGAFNS